MVFLSLSWGGVGSDLVGEGLIPGSIHMNMHKD